jgi:hypothetical protein
VTAIDVATIATEPKPEPPRDRFGRYLIPGPNNKPIAHTRATTVAKTMADTYALEQWQMRQVAAGLARRQDLIGLAAAHDPDTDRKVFEEIVEGALEASGSAEGRRVGTTLHRFTELIDLGQRTLDEIPEPYRARVADYRTALTDAGVQVHPEWVEQIFVLDGYTLAGTADRVVTLADGRRCIADLKTGKSVDFGQLEFAIQLAIYANHSAIYDQGKNRRGKPIPDVDRSTGLIIHLPAQGTGCALYTIDLTTGYDALITAMEVREWRKVKPLTPYRPLAAGTGGTGALRDWLRDRIRVAAGHSDAALADLGARWPATVPQPLPAELAQYQIEDLATALDRVEAAHGIPFGDTRPGTKMPQARSRTKR